MSIQTNIARNKYFRFIVGVVVVGVFLITLIAAAHKQSSSPISGLIVSLNDDEEFSFLQKRDIEQLLLKNKQLDLATTRIDQLDLKKMEQRTRTHPWVASANLFVDGKRRLQVDVQQRTPVVRIFDNSGGSYYMDAGMHRMPSVSGYNYPSPVFTNVPRGVKDSLNSGLFKKIITLGGLIGADSFWRAQITQVEVQADQTFVLISLLGNQRILFGDTVNATKKLRYLFDFYQQVSKKIGWDKYEVLDLRFNNQIVATPSIGWVAPKVLDTAVVVPPPAPPLDQPANTVAVAVKAVSPDPKIKTKATARAHEVTASPAKKATRTPTKTNTTKTSTKKATDSGKEKEVAQPKYVYPGNNQ